MATALLPRLDRFRLSFLNHYILGRSKMLISMKPTYNTSNLSRTDKSSAEAQLIARQLSNHRTSASTQCT
jgi:hypothetical protein